VVDPALVAAAVAAVDAAEQAAAAEQAERLAAAAGRPLDAAHKLLGLLLVAAEHTSNVGLLASLLKKAAHGIAARVEVRDWERSAARRSYAAVNHCASCLLSVRQCAFHASFVIQPCWRVHHLSAP
jgi:hypothetical protein